MIARACSPMSSRSASQSSAYSAEDMTDDAVAVLDAVGWDSAHLFCHSMGGQVAQRAALRHPRRAAARRTAKAITGARLVILPGVGHYLSAEVYPQVAGEVRALAERAAAAPSPSNAA
jgi:pimeloyl-ACP methyl ester carboxylesterase